MRRNSHLHVLTRPAPAPAKSAQNFAIFVEVVIRLLDIARTFEFIGGNLAGKREEEEQEEE